MKASIRHEEKSYEIDFAQPIDISIPVGRTRGPNAFYLSNAEYKTVEAGSFVGNVQRGGSCNCEDICFNPHGNGTHTECAGHISREPIYITQSLKTSFFPALLITVDLKEQTVTKENIEAAIPKDHPSFEAIIIRTLPNGSGKKTRNYSGSNPPYFSADAIELLNTYNIKHLLTDLPSLDKEDDARLTAHSLFFRKDNNWLTDRTVTEMVYAEDAVTDGFYFLDLQVPGFEADAAPSKPILYFPHLY